jgi:pilus assembly protein CpaF
MVHEEKHMNLKSRISQVVPRQETREETDNSRKPAPRPVAPLAIVTPQEQEWALNLHHKLVKVMDLSLITSMEEKDARQQIRDVSQQLMAEESMPLNEASRLRVLKLIEDEILGLGPLEPLLHDPTISDIMVNGANSVYVERHGKLEHSPIRFHNDAHLMNIIDRIVTRVGRRIDESSPMVDARLLDGSRVNAVVPPLALEGPSLSIRRFSVERLKLEDLIRLQTLNETIGAIIQGIVGARLNVLISGGTGSGKTTMLNVCSGFIPENERIVTIEDSAELQLQQPHTVRLETRPPNIEGKGEITQRNLVRNSLRMRPDRIVVGEVRGEEAVDMLQAMNTGHDGSLTTIHANTPRDALFRIENMFAMAGYNMPVKAVRSQIASAINVVLQLERMEDGHRRLVSLQEINGMEGDIITMSEIFRFERTGISPEGEVMGHFTTTGIIPKFLDKMQKRGFDIGYDTFENHRQVG